MDEKSEHETSPHRANESRIEPARKIASFVGSEENRATDIPGVTLHRQLHPSDSCPIGEGIKRESRHAQDERRVLFQIGWIRSFGWQPGANRSRFAVSRISND